MSQNHSQNNTKNQASSRLSEYSTRSDQGIEIGRAHIAQYVALPNNTISVKESQRLGRPLSDQKNERVLETENNLNDFLDLCTMMSIVGSPRFLSPQGNAQGKTPAGMALP
jgi:hypothetical protein